MSPLTLRRYRAERLLREEFVGLRGRVLASVRQRLLAAGARLDQSDLEACYAQAWHGLYAAMLDGQEIANPRAWLALVTFRRAIEECRARRHLQPGLDGREGDAPGAAASDRAAAQPQPDLAQQLDDRMRMRQLFEGLRGRLDARELEAAALCYVQGLTRAEAAARMGLSPARMRKLMEGRAPGRPGVAGKVGALLDTIRAGGWCEEQGSLMRALAFGVLDPRGERYRLAVAHRRQCPACRAYVVSLRGLAVALPPPLSPLLSIAGVLAHGGSAAGALASAKGTAAGGAPALGTATATGQGAAGAGGALSAAGAGTAGAAGGAGGGWLLVGGPLGAKLAVGCLLVLGIGAGCLALGGAGPATGRSGASHAALHPRAGVARGTPLTAGNDIRMPGPGAAQAPARGSSARKPRVGAAASPRTPSGSGEFTPEHGGVLAVAGPARPPAAPVAVAASAPRAVTPAAGEREFSPVATGP